MVLVLMNAATDEKGFFQGLKEKAASKFIKSDGRPSGNMNGAPPGSTNPPEGWSFATNRGPTSGNYGPSPGAYNPEETYRPSNFTGGGYRAGSAAYGGAPDTREIVSTQLREKSYGALHVTCVCQSRARDSLISCSACVCRWRP